MADDETPDGELLARAREAATRAYAPRSNYRVGAAIETAGGDVYTGCNVEVVNMEGSLCAERVALFSAVAAGEREFVRIAVVALDDDSVTPCGACRQALAEFCGDDLPVECGGAGTYTLGELLPAAWSADIELDG